jgi:hypothetical protein
MRATPYIGFNVSLSIHFPTSGVPKRKSRILSALILLANHILIAVPIVKPQARIQFSPSPSRCPTWPPCQAHWGGETPPWHHPRRRRCTRAQMGCRLGPKEAFLAWESIGFPRQFFFKWWNFISMLVCCRVIPSFLFFYVFHIGVFSLNNLQPCKVYYNWFCNF